MKNIIITGAAGTVGNAIIHQILMSKSAAQTNIIGLDKNENGVFRLKEKWGHRQNVTFFCEDVLRLKNLDHFVGGTTSIIHAAAMKHVPICQDSPSYCVQNNVVLLNHLIEISLCAGIDKFVFCSSDKAVNPTNVMGASKLLGEQICLATSGSQNMQTVITRFGNVFGSSGSVAQIFKAAIEAGTSIPITNGSMTRFFMSLEDAAALVLFAEENGKNGAIYVPQMAACSVIELANLMFDYMTQAGCAGSSTLETEIIGERLGEKLFEELMTELESKRLLQKNGYFEIAPLGEEISGNRTSSNFRLSSSGISNLADMNKIVAQFICPKSN